MEHTNNRFFPVTKKQLCYALSLVSPKGKCYYHILRRDYLDDPTLSQLGITEEDYHRRSIFPVRISRMMLPLLDLTPADVWPQKTHV